MQLLRQRKMRMLWPLIFSAIFFTRRCFTLEVAQLRKKLKLSQSKFSKVYHINIETLKKWEQRKRIPDSISRVYLKCIEKGPKIIKYLVNG